jgi:hypothetical protein
MDILSIIEALTSTNWRLSAEQAYRYPSYINGYDRIILNGIGVSGDTMKTKLPGVRTAREIIDRQCPGYPEELNTSSLTLLIRKGITSTEIRELLFSEDILPSSGYLSRGNIVLSNETDSARDVPIHPTEFFTNHCVFEE